MRTRAFSIDCFGTRYQIMKCLVLINLVTDDILPFISDYTVHKWYLLLKREKYETSIEISIWCKITPCYKRDKRA